MVRLRAWIYGNKQHASQSCVDDGDKELLAKVAIVHRTLVLTGQTSVGILIAAKNCASREDFERQLLNLEQGVMWKDENDLSNLAWMDNA